MEQISALRECLLYYLVGDGQYPGGMLGACQFRNGATAFKGRVILVSSTMSRLEKTLYVYERGADLDTHR